MKYHHQRNNQIGKRRDELQLKIGQPPPKTPCGDVASKLKRVALGREGMARRAEGTRKN